MRELANLEDNYYMNNCISLKTEELYPHFVQLYNRVSLTNLPLED